MMTVKARTIACGVAMLALGSARSLHAQLEVGTWVRQPTPSAPSITMKIEECCHGGRRLTYYVVMNGNQAVLAVESRLDGSDAPVVMGGKPSGETMAIRRVDAHHASAVLKMNGTVFGKYQATLSADGRTLTSVNNYTSSAGGQPVGTTTEIWVRK